MAPRPSMRSFLHVVGTRPNLMKAAPVMRALAHRSASQRLLHTGQHYDPEMSAEIARELDLPRPDVQLEAGSASHARQTAAVLVGVEDALVRLAPDAVVVYGDVNSTLGSALAAAKLGIPVAHVEAGLRSGDHRMPEEINRVLVDHMSAWLFATDTAAADHLRREGLAPERVHVVGNVMADSLLRVLRGADASPSGEALVTLHRPENVDDPDTFAALVRAVAELARTMPVLFPVHPRTRERLASGPLPVLLREAGVRLVPPLGYAAMARALCRARLVLTDSGGVQDECAILGVACITVRTTTERPATVSSGSNRVVGTSPDAIRRAVHAALKNPGRTPPPPLWDGHAGERIAAVLLDA